MVKGAPICFKHFSSDMCNTKSYIVYHHRVALLRTWLFKQSDQQLPIYVRGKVASQSILPIHIIDGVVRFEV